MFMSMSMFCPFIYELLPPNAPKMLCPLCKIVSFNASLDIPKGLFFLKKKIRVSNAELELKGLLVPRSSTLVFESVWLHATQPSTLGFELVVLGTP